MRRDLLEDSERKQELDLDKYNILIHALNKSKIFLVMGLLNVFE